MGNNIDKRTYRREFHEYFKQVIQHYQEKHVRAALQKQESVINDDNGNIRVFIRKRPIFQHEIAKNEFDVLTCPPWGGIIVHMCRQHPSLKAWHAFVESQEYPFPPTTVFDEKTNTETVYRGALAQMVRNSIRSGERGTCLMYGQTGTGKTYTITGVMRYLAKDVFRELARLKKESGGKRLFKINAVCVELIGDNLFDLNANGRQVQLLSDGQEATLSGTEEITIKSAQDIVKVYDDAASVRETHATAINSTSSRSHYVFRLIIKDAKTSTEYSRLTMVDLAGSERNADSLYHDAERQRESALINASLYSLKDVIRITALNSKAGRNKSANRHVNFRGSKLTMLLKDNFTSDTSKTVVISTLSPIATDTEHTMNTIQHLCMLTDANWDKENVKTVRTNVEDVLGEVIRAKQAPKIVPVSRWTARDVQNWLRKANNGQFKKFASRFQDNIDGKQLTRLTEQRFAQIVGNEAAGIALRKAILDHTALYNEQRKQEVKQQRDLMNGEYQVPRV